MQRQRVKLIQVPGQKKKERKKKAKRVSQKTYSLTYPCLKCQTKWILFDALITYVMCYSIRSIDDTVV